MKKITYAILLFMLFMGLFFAGGLAHKYGVHRKIGRIKCVSPFFYPAPRQDPSEIFQKIDVEYPFTFIVYGDSREPAGCEKDTLIAKIISEKPSFVLHLGDMVLRGDEHQWKIFDAIDGRIMDNGIPLYPVLGNHEYHARKESYQSNPKKQLQPYFSRFKFLKNRRWYSFRYDNSLFLMLDTNTDYSIGSRQYKWLMNILKKELSGFLFVAFHHSPYTKNERKSRRKSERSLADIFENYDEGLMKADIVFSGDVHNYERYRHNGINYVVSGGGGASQYSVKRDPDDFYTIPGETFHYCKITVSETRADFEMIRLDKDTERWIAADTFTIDRKAALPLSK